MVMSRLLPWRSLGERGDFAAEGVRACHVRAKQLWAWAFNWSYWLGMELAGVLRQRRGHVRVLPTGLRQRASEALRTRGAIEPRFPEAGGCGGTRAPH